MNLKLNEMEDHVGAPLHLRNKFSLISQEFFGKFKKASVSTPTRTSGLYPARVERSDSVQLHMTICFTN